MSLPKEALSAIMVGSRIAGRYEIIELIGEGGWAFVYKAMNTDIGKPVAIKLLHERYVDNPEKMARFRKEAEAACSITHPNLVSVIDYGVLENGQPYIVMEFFQGPDLSELLEHGPVKWGNVAVILEDMSKALMAIQAKGLVHRDIKPSNIVLNTAPDGQTYSKLLDFGLVRSVGNDHTMTATGQVIGTPIYMSPEQCRGLPIDTRCDLYALGCVAYQSLTGVHPMMAETHVEIMFKQVNEEFPPLDKIAPICNVPPALEAIVFKLLAKNPDERYQTAGELLDDLEKFREDPCCLRSLVSAMDRHRSQKPASKVPLAVSAMLGLSVAAAIAIAVSLPGLQKNNNNNDNNNAPKQQAGSKSALEQDIDALMRTADIELNHANYVKARDLYLQVQKSIRKLPNDDGRAQIVFSRLDQCRRGKAVAMYLSSHNLLEVNADVSRVVKALEEHARNEKRFDYDLFSLAEINALKTANSPDGRTDTAKLARDVDELTSKLHAKSLLPDVDVVTCNNNSMPISFRGVTPTDGKKTIATLGKLFHFDSAGHVETVDGADGHTTWVYSKDGSFHRHENGQRTGEVSWDIIRLLGNGDELVTHWDGSSTLNKVNGTSDEFDSAGTLTQSKKADPSAI